LSWLNVIFKTPWKKTKIVLILKSNAQQTGKGIIVEEFLNKYIFGDLSFYDTGFDGILSRFNDHLMNKIFITLDELPSINEKFHSNFDKMKSFITGDKTAIEVKNGLKFNIDNYMNFILMTNNDFTIKLEKEDRRYAVFEVSKSKAGDYEYFNKLARCFNNRNADVFFSYVMDLKNPANIRDIPETENRKLMMEANISSAQRFIKECKNFLIYKNDMELQQGQCEDCLNETSICEEHTIIYDYKWQRNAMDCLNAADLFGMYKEFCSDNNERKVFNLTSFGRDIKDEVIKKRFRNGYKYILNGP
jgi:phage/plasmid-associated DNA primase